MHSRPRSTARILIATALATAIWEIVVATFASPYLRDQCQGWCSPLRLAYALPIVVLPVVAAWRWRPPGVATLVPFLMIIASSGASYATLLGLWITEEMILGGVGVVGLAIVAVFVALPQVVLPTAAAIVIVTVIGELRARRYPVQEPVAGSESDPSSS